MGFTERANKILAQNKVLLYTDHVRKEYPDGTFEDMAPKCYHDIPRRASGRKWQGMFDGESGDLMVYTLCDGTEVEEYIQAEPWSSGPMIFLALRNTETKEPLKWSLWTDGEIDQVTGEKSLL